MISNLGISLDPARNLVLGCMSTFRRFDLQKASCAPFPWKVLEERLCRRGPGEEDRGQRTQEMAANSRGLKEFPREKANRDPPVTQGTTQSQGTGSDFLCRKMRLRQVRTLLNQLRGTGSLSVVTEKSAIEK